MRAVWSYGEGPETVTKVGSTKLVSESHFAVGPSLHSYPPSAKDTEPFGFYWFEQPDFDVVQLAKWSKNPFRYMKSFFHDTELTYHVFMRGSASSSGMGGEALPRSFMFNYIISENNNWESFQRLMAHEMVHNWPTMSGEDDDKVTWYNEGIADYYSMVLPLRLGIFTLDRFVRGMNNIATAYYTNPMVGLTNEEIAARGLEGELAEVVPYGRGMLFLISLDTQIRSRSNGTRSIDDIMLNLLNRTRSGQSDHLEDLLEILKQELGPGVRDEYARMVNATLLVPPENSLSRQLTVQKTELEQYEVGFERGKEDGESAITQVVPNSRAEQAGLMVGDEVVWTETRFTNSDVIEAYEDVDAETDLKVRRDERELSITYRSRGFKKVEAYLWVIRNDTLDSSTVSSAHPDI